MKRRTTLASLLTLAFVAVGATSAGAATQTFTQNTDVVWDGFGSADPYPSQLAVDGVSGEVTKVTVGFDDLDSTDRTDALSFVLEGPDGQTVRLMNGAGGDDGAFNINIVFDDDAILSVPTPLASAAFKPTDKDPGDNMSGPAPSAPYGSALSVFNGIPANGNWRLWVQDSAAPGNGSIKGWSLKITTADDPGPGPGPGPDPDPDPDPGPGELTLKLDAAKQDLARRLTVEVDASAAGTLAFSGKARGSVKVDEGTSTVDARLDPGAFKKLKKKLKKDGKASVVVEGTLKAGGKSADGSTKVKLE